MKKVIRFSENDIKKIVKESVDNYLNNGTFEDEGISNSGCQQDVKKWVYWCFNFNDPQEWIGELQGAPAQHFMNKFEEYYDHYGADGVMNRFFLNLDSTNQEILINYVMNNYKG